VRSSSQPAAPSHELSLSKLTMPLTRAPLTLVLTLVLMLVLVLLVLLLLLRLPPPPPPSAPPQVVQPSPPPLQRRIGARYHSSLTK